MAIYKNFLDLDLSKQYSYADYLLFEFNERVEILKGYIYAMSPAPSRKHQHISANIFRVFDRLFFKKPCAVYFAPFDVRLKINENSEEITTVLQPDLCIICDENKLDEKGCLGAPDLVVEILSPGNTKKEMELKFEIYEQSGVKEYWIVQPEYENVLLFELSNGKYELKSHSSQDSNFITSTIFPDLHVSLEEIFRV